MKKLVYTLFLGIIILTACKNAKVDGSSLAKGFVLPPDSIQTSIYWYWISDHISKEGVVKDLHAMKEAGLNRAFIGNIGLSEGEAGVGNVKFYSDEWWEILHTTLKTATELGIDIGIFNSPGWSQSGGPWVKPEQAMRYLAYTSTQVAGGAEINIALNRPESEFKDSFQDVKVLAFPTVEEEILTNGNTKVKVTPQISNIQQILEDNETEVVLANVGEGGREVSIDFVTNQPFTLRSLKLYMSKWGIDSPAKIQVKEGNAYKTLAEFSIVRFNPQLNVGFDPYAPIVISVPATTAKEFRLIVSNINGGAGLRNAVLSTKPQVERYPEKTLAKMHQTPLPMWHEYQWRQQPSIEDASLLLDPATIIDISDKLKGDQLTWNAPAGEWTIMRMGMLPTGVTNGPASPEARGLETDKMSKKHIESHFEAYLGEIYRRIPAEDRKCWKVVVEDSYETGGQNFTDEFLNDFKEHYGYDPLPFLPVYAGVVVQSEDISDRFLWDMRRFVADKVAYEYVAGLREVSHKYGLTTWLENYGHWGFPGEFLQYGGQSDEIGGEFWSEGSLGDIENRAASSCAHIYGKTKVSAESFTAGGGGYHRYPAMMKQRGDRFFSEGINNTLLHLYIAQPYEDKDPGVNAPFSNEFNRKNIWYPHFDLFINYLKRTNFMLQQGLNVADVAYFIGEDAPKMTGIVNPPLPKGYQFDYINAEVIERDMFVRDGQLTLPHGTQYKILVLPEMETMRPELLAKIEQLINDGAVVMGLPPKWSPSYQNYPEADTNVTKMAESLWTQVNPDSGYAKIGKGLLISEMNMEKAMKLIECAPDCAIENTDPILYGHRKVGDIDIYFVSNQADNPHSFTPEFRVQNMQPELWNAVTGEIRPLPAFEVTASGTKVPLKLDRFESAFIVFREILKSQPATATLTANFPEPQIIEKLESNWKVSFEEKRRGPKNPIQMNTLINLATSDNDSIKYYSGMLNYETSFNLKPNADNSRMYINLNDLSAMAKVKVNDEYVGGVWTYPYKLDISKALKEGENKIEIEVSTTWVNRLIGDLNLPESERKTWLTFQPWRASDGLHKSGLIGPVVIEKVLYE